MKKVKFTLIALAAFALVGCGTVKAPSEPEIVYRTRLVQITVPSNLVTNAPVPVPPQKQAYLEASDDMKESMLVDYVNALLKSLDEANNTITSIREWSANASKVFKSQNQKPVKE